MVKNNFSSISLSHLFGFKRYFLSFTFPHLLSSFSMTLWYWQQLAEESEFRDC